MEAVLAVAAVQYGLFTSAQWVDAGLSRRRLTYKKQAGLVLEPYPGVFALAGAPSSFEQQVLALCLSVNGAASHRCAAYLWGFRKFEAPMVEVVTRRDHTPSWGHVTVRRTRQLNTSDIETVRGIPVTSRARTLLDLCDSSPGLAEGALNGALHKRQVNIKRLQAALDRVAPRHPGAVRFREQRNASKANELLDWWIVRFVHDDIHRWPHDTAEFLLETIARRRRQLAA